MEVWLDLVGGEEFWCRNLGGGEMGRVKLLLKEETVLAADRIVLAADVVGLNGWLFTGDAYLMVLRCTGAGGSKGMSSNRMRSPRRSSTAFRPSAWSSSRFDMSFVEVTGMYSESSSW